MISMIRIFENGEQAIAAAGMLRDEGFGAEDIIVLSPENPDSSTMATAIRAGNALGRNNPQVVADAISQGRSIVVCQVQFGRGQAACNIMDNCGAVDSHLLAEQAEYHKGAPFSSAMGWPVLTNNPTPFSYAFGLSTTQTGPSWISKICVELKKGFTFGSPKLSSNAAPLSSKIGLGLLKDGPTDSSFGLPLKSGDATPLSSKIGMRTLSSNPTPMSSKMGIPTLKNSSRR